MEENVFLISNPLFEKIYFPQKQLLNTWKPLTETFCFCGKFFCLGSWCFIDSSSI